MRLAILFIILLLTTLQVDAQPVGHYADVNGIRMYYEIHGDGAPIVLIHGGGSTLATSFGRLIPLLAQHRKVIAVEMQAHGHTSDRDAPESFRQDAEDIVALLRHLKIARADILGFSNGGQTAIELGVRHPESVRKLVIASAFYSRDAVAPEFWKGFGSATLNMMPKIYQDAYLAITHDSTRLLNMFHRDVERMRTFTGWTDEEIKSIEAPALVVIGDRDLPTPEHAAKMARLIPHGRLAILPGTHGSYLGEAMTGDAKSSMTALFATMVEEFLTNDN